MLNLFSKNGPTSEELNLEKKPKKRILLLVDVYDWCFFNIASRIKKQLQQYTFDILTTVDLYNNIKTIARNPYHTYVFFYPTLRLAENEIQYLKNVGKYKFDKPSTIFWCMYDNFSWRVLTDYNKGSLYKLRNGMVKWMSMCDGYLWGFSQNKRKYV